MSSAGWIVTLQLKDTWHYSSIPWNKVSSSTHKPQQRMGLMTASMLRKEPPSLMFWLWYPTQESLPVLWIWVQRLPVDLKIWQDSCSVLRHSKTIKEEYFRGQTWFITVATIAIGIITICRQWKHECHCDCLESHNKVTCLIKWRFIQKSVHQSYCHNKEGNCCNY